MTSPRIIVGDCREVLTDFPDASFDAIIADPPYQQTSLVWDRWPVGWPAAVRRLLKPTGSMWVFGSLRMFMDRRDDFVGWRMAQDIVWEKHNGSSFHADRFRRVHEQAVQFYRDDALWAEVYKGKVVTMDARKRQVRWKQRPDHLGKRGESAYRSEDGGPRLARSVIYCRSEHGRAVHPTQKPVGIVDPLIVNACPPGGLILDPFSGSGTTGVAAQMLGRSFVGVEAREDYAAISRSRIANEAGLFAGAAE